MTMRSRLIVLVIAAFAIGLVIGAAAAPALMAPPKGVKKRLPKEIPIGALLALTGHLSSFAKRHEAAARMAIKDINEYVKRLGYDVKFKLYVEDTKCSDEEALAKIQALAAKGIKVVLGPLASSEVKAIKSFADSNKIVVISHSSTSPALAIPSDFIFRFVPTDEFQGRALAKYMVSRGFKKVAVIYRGDPWGDLLFESFKKNFEELGGVVKGVRYDPHAKELSAEVRRLSDIVKEFGMGPETAVLLISFEDDGLAVIKAAEEDPVLSTVPWVGTDGTAGSLKLAKEAGEFLVKVGGLPSTIFNPTLSPKQKAFAERFKREYGEAPDSYCFTIYDAAWVAALTILEVGEYNPELIAKALPEVASRYFGVSGWTLLNEAGDRAGGDYIIMKLAKVGDKYEWVEEAIYVYSADAIQPLGG